MARVQLQRDIIALESAIGPLHEGRLKSALEAMTTNSLKRTLEQPVLGSEVRIKTYYRIRNALVAPVLAAVAAATPAKAGAASTPSATEDSKTEEDTPTPLDAVPEPPLADEIPFVLQLDRAEIASDGCRVLSKVLQHKVMLGRLSFIDLSSNGLTLMGQEFDGITALCKQLANLPNLRFLSLHNNILMEQGAAAVAQLLQGSRSLLYLDISRCSLGPNGAAQLLPAFYRPALPDPADAAVGGATDSKEGDAAVTPSPAADAAADDDDDEEEEHRRPTAAELEAEEYEMLTVGMRHAEGDIIPNSSLLWFDISENNIAGYGHHTKPGQLLCASLLRHPSLQVLDVSTNRLTRVAVTAITDNLVNNKALRVLKCERNDIDAGPANRLCDALAQNSSLTAIGLRGNRIRSDGASAFAALLRAGTSALQYADLRDNYIGEVGLSDLKRALLGQPPPPEVTRGMDRGGAIPLPPAVSAGAALESKSDMGDSSSERPYTASSTGSEGGASELGGLEASGDTAAELALRSITPSYSGEGSKWDDGDEEVEDFGRFVFTPTEESGGVEGAAAASSTSSSRGGARGGAGGPSYTSSENTEGDAGSVADSESQGGRSSRAGAGAADPLLTTGSAASVSGSMRDPGTPGTMSRPATSSAAADGGAGAGASAGARLGGTGVRAALAMRRAQEEAAAAAAAVAAQPVAPPATITTLPDGSLMDSLGRVFFL